MLLRHAMDTVNQLMEVRPDIRAATNYLTSAGHRCSKHCLRSPSHLVALALFSWS